MDSDLIGFIVLVIVELVFLALAFIVGRWMYRRMNKTLFNTIMSISTAVIVFAGINMLMAFIIFSNLEMGR